MIGAFNKIVKRLVGDKAATDVKAIQPAVDAVHTFESEMAGVVLDGLRERSADLSAASWLMCRGCSRVQRLRAQVSLQSHDVVRGQGGLV